MAFFRRRQMKTELGLEEEAMRDYFPLPTVLDGIFGLICYLDPYIRDDKAYQVRETVKF